MTRPDDRKDRQHARENGAVARPVDPHQRERSREPGRWGLIGEALLAQRLDALLQHLIGDLDPLALVNLAQALDERLVGKSLRELLLHDALVVAQRVDDIHRQHQIVELGALPGGGRVRH